MLSKNALAEFKKIYLEEGGEMLSEQEATTAASNLISLVSTIYRPLPKTPGGRTRKSNYEKFKWTWTNVIMSKIRQMLGADLPFGSRQRQAYLFKGWAKMHISQNSSGKTRKDATLEGPNTTRICRLETMAKDGPRRALQIRL